MDNINLITEPIMDQPTMLVAFRGWPDAGESATGAVRYLREKLKAILFAELRAEEFYVFTESRPRTIVRSDPWEHRTIWPRNRLYFWKGGDEAPDLILLLGKEPDLKWVTFVDSILDLAQRFSVAKVFSLGGALDSIPHSREPSMSGSSFDPALMDVLKSLLAWRPSNYEGPTSIHTALIDGCERRGLPHASLWGRGPIYLQSTPNPRVCYSLLKSLVTILKLPLDLDDIREAAAAFDHQIDEAVAKNPDLQEYVHQLEQAADKAEKASEEMPSPEAIVKDLEEYLRRRGRQRKNGPDKESEN